MGALSILKILFENKNLPAMLFARRQMFYSKERTKRTARKQEEMNKRRRVYTVRGKEVGEKESEALTVEKAKRTNKGKAMHLILAGHEGNNRLDIPKTTGGKEQREEEKRKSASH